MEARRGAHISALLLVGVVLAGCSLNFAPSVTLSVPAGTVFTTVPVRIPYAFNSARSAETCTWTITKRQLNGTWEQLSSITRVLESSGTIVFDPASAAGNDVASGRYRLTLAVATTNGSPTAYAGLSANTSFIVQAAPYIESVSPPMFNVNMGVQTITVTGWGFDATSTLGTAAAAAESAPVVYDSPTSLTVSMNFSALNLADGTLAFQVNTGTGAPTQVVNIPIVSTVTLSVQPNGWGTQNQTKVPIFISGSYLNGFTKISFLSASGAAVPFTIAQSGFNLDATGSGYVLIDADLTKASPNSTGSITVSNQDSTGAPTTATMPFYFGP